MANLLGHKSRTAKRLTTQQASGTVCAALVPTKGQTTRESRGRPLLGLDGGRWRPQNTFKGLRGGNSSGRFVLVPFDSLEQLIGALARANPQKVKSRSCMVLGLKPMGKLITCDKYLSVRQNQGLAWFSDSNLQEN